MDLTNLKEMMLIKEAGAGFFSEAKQYNDAGEFSDEFYDLFAQVTKMKKIMKHPKWMEYMRTLDRTGGSMAVGSAQDAIKAVTDLEDHLKDIDREMDRLSGGSGSRTQEEPDA